jgi:hypothetical protein
LEWSEESEIVSYRNIAREKKWKVLGEDSQTEPFDRYHAMLAHFARCVRGEQENEFTPDYELEVYRLLQACCGNEE